jgi:hypothetical protein
MDFDVVNRLGALIGTRGFFCHRASATGKPGRG